MSEQEVRLRPHSGERFAGECHVVDLGRALSQLRAESRPAPRGHRHVTVFHRDLVTQALFAFEPGGALTDHVANGLVTIHALDGCLTVQAAGETYQLQAGMMVILTPGVRHSVHAEEPGAMLLTVCLENHREKRMSNHEAPYCLP